MRNDDERDPFGIEPEAEESVMDALYGSTEGLRGDPNRVVSKGLDVAAIWADVRQPRRAVPASVRLHWNGDPEAVPELLAAWREIAFDRAGRTFSVKDVLQGKGEGIETEDAPAIFREYVELCRLAASINKDGLINPITVARTGQRHMIIAGERRWLAYWLLHLELGGNHAHIPATETDGSDWVWKQASENTARRSLNAIGMARQLALLIMEARTGIDGQRYDAYETLVVPGGCDRRFYAQIANGNVHRIPKGFGERIQAAMALSEKRIADYRRLLRLTDDDLVNDAIWIRADVEDWPERVIRDIGTLPMGKVREVIEGDQDWTLDDLRGLAPSPPAPSPTVGRGENKPSERIAMEWGDGRPVTDAEMDRLEGDSESWKASRWGGWSIGDAVVTPGGHAGKVDFLMPSGRIVVVTAKGAASFKPEELRPAPDTMPGLNLADVVTGDPVMVTLTGETGMVLAFSGERVLVDVRGKQTWYEAADLAPSQAKYADYAPEPDHAGFGVGMAVLISHTQEIGEILKAHDGGVFEVDVDGTVETYKRRELLPLMQTMEEFVSDEIEAGEADFEDWDETPAPAPAPAIRADKADSVGPHPPAPSPSGRGGGIDDMRVWKAGSMEYAQLDLLARLAKAAGHAHTNHLVLELRDMTPAQIKRLAANGKLDDTLTDYYNAISEFLVEWVERDLWRVLDIYRGFAE